MKAQSAIKLRHNIIRYVPWQKPNAVHCSFTRRKRWLFYLICYYFYLEDNSTDTLFIFEEARLVFIKFKRLDASTIGEISILFVVRLGAVKTNAVDALGQKIKRLSNRVENSSDSGSKTWIFREPQWKRARWMKDDQKVEPYHMSPRSDFWVCYQLLHRNFLNMQEIVWRSKMVQTTAHCSFL